MWKLLLSSGWHIKYAFSLLRVFATFFSNSNEWRCECIEVDKRKWWRWHIHRARTCLALWEKKNINRAFANLLNFIFSAMTSMSSEARYQRINGIWILTAACVASALPYSSALSHSNNHLFIRCLPAALCSWDKTHTFDASLLCHHAACLRTNLVKCLEFSFQLLTERRDYVCEYKTLFCVLATTTTSSTHWQTPQQHQQQQTQ